MAIWCMVLVIVSLNFCVVLCSPSMLAGLCSGMSGGFNMVLFSDREYKFETVIIILVRGDLIGLVSVINPSNVTYEKIRKNLYLAFFYNI